MMSAAGRPAVGLVVHQGSGCLSPRVREFLCLETPRSVLAEGDDALPFYILPGHEVAAAVQQGSVPCPALWVDEAAVEAGVGMLQVVFCLGRPTPRHCPLPLKPIKLQPVRKAAGEAGSPLVACKAYVSGKAYTQLYRLVAGLLPTLDRLHHELASTPGVELALPGRPAAALGSGGAVRATPFEQGVLLEAVDSEGGPHARLTLAVNFGLVCVELRGAGGPEETGPLRTVHCLSEALTALRGEAGPALAASPVKPGSTAGSPTKPPLQPGAGLEPLRLGVQLVQACTSTQLREGVALLSAAAGDAQLTAACLGLGAIEALVTAAGTVLPSSMMGMTELLASLVLAVTTLLDAAPPAAYAAGRLVSIMGAALQQSCANPVLLCQLMTALLQRPDVRAEAMRHNLGGSVASLYVRLSVEHEAAARSPLAPLQVPRQPSASTPGSRDDNAAQPAYSPLVSSPAGQARGGAFGSPAPVEQIALAAGSGSHVARMVSIYNQLSDSGSEGSPCSSASPSRSPPLRSPSAMLGRVKFRVPRLQLPNDNSPMNPAAGLTRSTRRALSNTPGGRRSPTPTPWGSPSRQRAGSAEPAELSAAAQMAAVAGAVGEGLIAADLPSIIALKRRADAAAGGGAAAGAGGDDVPPELLETPALAPAAGRRALEAHRILITARSLKSVESSTTHVTDSEADGPARCGRHLADEEQLKCLALHGLLLALPVMGAAEYPSPDPAPVLAQELLSLVGKPLSMRQEQLKQLALQTLQRLSQRPGVEPGACHPLAAAIGARLQQSLGGGGDGPGEEATAQACQLMQLLQDYVAGVEAASVAVAIMQHCLPGLQALLGALLAAAGLDPAAWPATCWQLFHGAVALLGPICQIAEDPDAGRAIVGLLLADRQAAELLAQAAEHLLLAPESARQQTRAYRSSMPSLQRDLLHLLTALASLVGRLPALPKAERPPQEQRLDAGRTASRLSLLSASSGGDELASSTDNPLQGPANDLLLGPSMRHGLTRKHALQFFGFLVSPNLGLAQRLLDGDVPPSAAAAATGTGAPPPRAPRGAHIRLRQGLLELLKALFATPGSPFVADKDTSDHYVRLHFIQFLKLYHNPQRDHQALFLCRQHLAVLQVLAGAGAAHARHRFQQLSVLDFLVRELGLEAEAAQPGRCPAARAGSMASNARRSSSTSSLLDSARASPQSSPAASVVMRQGAEAAQPGAPPAPLPRLPLTAAPAPAADNAPVAQGSGGKLHSSLAVPRLNLGGFGSGASSPGGSGTSSPRSARLGRPPLPPSARAGMGNTPRVSSRLGRLPSGQAADRAPTPPSLLADAKAAKPSGSAFAIAADARTGAAASDAKPAVPRLGLASLSHASGSGEQQQQRVAAPAVPQLQLGAALGAQRHAESHPSASTLDADSSSDEEVDGEAGRASGGRPGAAGQGPRTFAGMAVPPGFVFSGDVEEDLERLEALEQVLAAGRGGKSLACCREGPDERGERRSCASQLRHAPCSLFPDRRRHLRTHLSGGPHPCQGSDEELVDGDPGSQTASPTIPAMRATPFQQALHVPPLFGGSGVPRLALGSKADLPNLGSQQQHQQHEPPQRQQQHQQQEQRAPARAGGAPAVPRLALTAGMHSNLETRTASAEVALAAAAEQAKRQEGRSYLGDLEKSALGKGKMQAADPFAGVHRAHSRRASMSGERRLRLRAHVPACHVTDLAADLSFAEERRRRLLYRDADLHLSVLQLVFTLLLDARGQLDPAYCDAYPWERRLPNAPFALSCHLSHEDNRALLPRLLPRLAALGPPAQRLARLLCSALFRPEWYAPRWRLSGAAGAYATVYRCRLPAWAGEGVAVLKLVDTPRHAQDRCSQVDVAGEVGVLTALAGCPAACALHDFGVDPGAEALALVLKSYRCSLKQWRARQPASPAGQLRLYLSIFQEVVAAVAELQARGVVHFDLKCDNVLLEPLPGVPAPDFWGPPSEAPPFRVVLADFGESRLFPCGLDGAATGRARGTDAFKSPEMLLVGGASHKDAGSYDRRRRGGAGPASDVWSLGCLLYELVTGQLLFGDSDWLALVARVTSPGLPLVTEERGAPLARAPGVLDLLCYMLVRDARMRPTLQDVQSRLNAIQHSSRLHLPPHMRPPPATARTSDEGVRAGSPTPLPDLRGEREPLPLLAPLPLLERLVLAPVAALHTAAAVRTLGAARVVLLVQPCQPGGTASGTGPMAAISNAVRAPLAGTAALGGGAASSNSRGAGSPPTTARLDGAAYSANHNPLFSPSIESTAGSADTVARPRSVRTPAGAMPRRTPRALGLHQGAVHPDEQQQHTWSSGPASAASGGPGREADAGVPRPWSARQRVALQANRVHPAPCSSSVGGSSAGSSPRVAPRSREPAALPAAALASRPGASAELAGTAGGSLAEPAREEAALQRVLADSALLPAAEACGAAGAECHVLFAGGSAAWHGGGLGQLVLLERWLGRALALLEPPEGGGTVVLAAEPGCEAEAALACVACLVRQGASLWEAMVAASQWGIDLHLAPCHLAVLQRWEAARDGR
eukprot:scaffold3.g6671.t1